MPTRAPIATGSPILVQPFLTSDVVGSGGPNVVPADDPRDGSVHRARARRTDSRAARRPHRRARARLQHGVPPRGARRDRRLQSDLPPRRRRRRRLLAAAGPRLEDRLRVSGARLASPSRVGEGVLAPAGRLRRGRALADGASPRQVSRRPDAVARADLQSAALRSIALGRTRQRRRLGHRGVSVGLSHRHPSRLRSCRTR